MSSDAQTQPPPDFDGDAPADVAPGDLPPRLVAGGAPLSGGAGDSAAPTIGNDPTRTWPSAASTSPAAPTLIGDYQILDEIAHGGMGVVFRARQVSLNRPVALKMILAGRLAGRAALERFRLEATAVAQLDHPNIVPIYEVGVDGGQHFFSMRLIEGGSLVDRLDKFRDDPRATAALLEKVARAIHHAHQRGVLHRDLKPGNILLDVNGEPCVGDFGLAKWSESGSNITQSEACLGTPGFMAPEQVRGAKDITTAADVYSLGAILYQMLTGLPPFTGESPAQVLRQVVEEEPPTPRSLRPRVSRDLETICLKCLRKDPHQRYASAEALADDLRRFRLGEPIEARTVGTIERLWSWCRRKPALAAAGATAIVAVVAALISLSLGIVFVSRAQTRERQKVAELLLESGKSSFANDDAGKALLSLTSGLDRAVKSGASDLERSIRMQLGVWQRFVHPLVCVVDHGGEVQSVAISADGRTIIAGCTDAARVWSVSTGQPLAPPLRHPGQMPAIAIDPSGLRAVTGSDDGVAIEWDLATGKPIGEPITHGGPLRAISFSGDGRLFATVAAEGQVRLFDAATARLKQTLALASPGSSVDFCREGNTLVTGTEAGTVQTWDAASGKLVDGTPVIETGESVRAARLALDGDVLTWTASHVLRWSRNGSPEKLQVPSLPEGTHAVGLCRTNLMLSGGDDKLARLWDTADGQPVGPPMGHPSDVRAAAISMGGKLLVTGCRDGSVRVWQVARGETPYSPLAADGPIQALAVNPAGGMAVTGDADGSAIAWNLANGSRTFVAKHDDWVMSAAFGPGGTTLVTGARNGKAFVWNGQTGALLPPPLVHGDDKTWVRAAAISPDGRRVVTGGIDGIAHLWSPASTQPVGSAMQHQDAITAVAFRHDGWNVVTASRDGSARLWDAESGRPIGEPMWHDQGAVWAAAFNPAGRFLATAGEDRTVRLWDDSTGRAIGAPLPLDDRVNALAFNPQGTAMAAACDNGSISVWDVTGVPAAPPRLVRGMKHTGSVAALAFSPSGRLLLAGGGDNTARLWDLTTTEADPVGPPLRHEKAIVAVAFDPSERMALTAGGEDGALRVWPIAPATGTANDARLAAEVATGVTSDDRGTVRWLSASEWWERKQRVERK